MSGAAHREKGWNAGGQVAWFADRWKSRVSTASLGARGRRSCGEASGVIGRHDN